MLNFSINIKAISDILIIILCSFNAVANNGIIGDNTSPETIFILYVAAVAALVPDMFGLKERPKKKQRIEPIKRTTPRTRRDIDNIMAELGETFTRRAYRMTRRSFWKLLGILHPQLELQSIPPKKKTKRGARNGVICHACRLSIALRYFAGGSPVDIVITHGVSHTAVFESVWEVVDAINKCDKLKFQFPTDHAKQHELAAGFTQLSKAGFNICVAAIDGIMIWINQPSDQDCTDNNFSGPTKFFCGRKKKFGLNMQGVCDSKCRFVDINIKQPGATSDYLAFNCMELKASLEQPGFLAPGLCLFGDNAYVNTTYMATPYKGTVSESQDAYNFFHSQLRITIERTFGIFVHRWGILRRAMPQNITLAKTSAIVLCLARLHNYCIDNNEGTPLAALARDDLYIALDCRGFLENPDDNLQALIGAGHHFDDIPERNTRRRLGNARPGNRRINRPRIILPQDILHAIVVEKDLKRPRPVAKRRRTM